MAEFPALPLWTDALIGDTYDLSATEFGAYMRLLIVAWRRPECDLPDDDAFLRRSVGATRGWSRIKAKIMPRFWRLEDARWTQARLRKERQYVSQLSSIRSDAGRANSLKRWGMGDANGNAMAMPKNATHTHTYKKEALAYNLEEKYKETTTMPSKDFRFAETGEHHHKRRDDPEFKAWLEYARKNSSSFFKELKQRASEGRAFDFPTQWPPGYNPDFHA